MTAFSPAQAAQIIAQYKAGQSLTQLAERWHADPSTIQRVLKRAGVSRRPRGGYNRRSSP